MTSTTLLFNGEEAGDPADRKHLRICHAFMRLRFNNNKGEHGLSQE